MSVLDLIDKYLNRFTTYRLLYYYLIWLVGAAVLLSAAGLLHYDPVGLAFSAGYLVLVCWALNLFLARIFRATTNVESSYITGLILALIITPLSSPHDILFLTTAAGLATASKYVLAIAGKHIFNPAAIAVVLTAWGAGQSASWWVGSTAMLPFVLAGGVLLVRRLREWPLVLAFLASAFAASALLSLTSGSNALSSLQQTALTTAVFFLGFVMLTEPRTAPRTRRHQLWFAGLVGLLFAPQIHLGPVYSTPELALIIGNIYAWMVNPKFDAHLALINKRKLSERTAEFEFKPAKLPAYQPGQYMEWTLPHPGADARGDRRYFTLASSPTEPSLLLGVRFAPGGSTFKRHLIDLPAGGTIRAGQISGDFVLPPDSARPLLFIAGGIGITPFRSMIKYLLDTGDRRSVELIYAESTPADLVYTDVFEHASAIGVRTTYAVTSPGAQLDGPNQYLGHITAEFLKSHVPDFAKRLVYVSGPPDMVAQISRELKSLGVPGHRIRTDYFPGLEGE